jgi:hypothetical protein
MSDSLGAGLGAGTDIEGSMLPYAVRVQVVGGRGTGICADLAGWGGCGCEGQTLHPAPTF